MGKKILSLCMALALCLGLLPVTAEAAAGGAPSQLYVGNQQVSSGNDITCWTTDEGGNLTQSADNQSWNVKYDPTSATLTLSGATIKGGSDVASIPYGAGIYAQCSNGQSVTLTIKLIGENTITGTFGIYVNAEINASSYGTNATLTIMGDNNGSLEVSGSNNGIYVKSGTGNASLNIKNVAVTSSTNDNYAAGVYVMSSNYATNSPNISLSVDGGSLTASGTGSRDGILFYVGSSQATGATTSLTVSENAIVDARNGGISALKISETLPTPTPTGNNSSGIVFDDKNGTVYGDVTLDESLTIEQDETLTIPSGSSLNANGNLTNNGTILASGGTVTGSLSDNTQVTTPTISVQPQNKEVQEGSAAEFSVTASGAQTYQWQQSTDNGSSWANIESATSASYTISSTATDMSNYQYRCVVKSASGVGVISQAATLTVTAKPAYTVTVNANPTEGGTVTVNSSTSPASVTAGSTVNLVATANEGYRFTGWTFSDNITDADSSSANTTFTMPAGDVTVTANFKQVYTVTVNASAGGTATADKTTAVAGEAVTLTATPNSGYHFDRWNIVSGTITIQNNQFTMPDGNVEIQAIFDRNSSGGSTTPSKTPSQQAVDKIESAKDGSTVEIKLSTGSTKLDKEVFQELAGRDVTLEISLSNGVTWTVNGQDIPANAKLTDIDMGVSMNTSTIPVDLINAVTGEIGTVQLTLKHNGEFGFTMTLTAPVGVKNAGLWANLYHYDEDAGKMVYQTAALVDEDGNVALPFDHASQYALVLDSKSHDLPFTDLAANAWYTDDVAYVYRHDIMEGMSATTFQPNGTLSRAQAVQIFYNLEGQPDISGENLGYPYEDVNAEEWYGDAVYWARITGVATGYGDGTFQPTDSITRQEFAQMLYNYAKYKDYDLSAEGDLSQFPDSGSVADWAEAAMSWANGEGLINGHDDGTIDAAGIGTRAQAASILMRFDQNLVEK